MVIVVKAPEPRGPTRIFAPRGRSAAAKPPASLRWRLVRVSAKAIVVGVLGYVVIWLVVVGGLFGAHAWAAAQVAGGSGATLAGIRHFQQVDVRLWRGAAPGDAGYRALAAMGVHTVVDLRAEHLSRADLAEPAQAGLHAVRLPIRDGQTPTTAQVDAFRQIVSTADGPVFVHCGAGVGRTGAMTAAYLVRIGEADADQAAVRTLAIGPPSVEQAYYVLTADHDSNKQPPVAVQIASRILDAPRRVIASL